MNRATIAEFESPPKSPNHLTDDSRHCLSSEAMLSRSNIQRKVSCETNLIYIHRYRGTETALSSPTPLQSIILPVHIPPSQS